MLYHHVLIQHGILNYFIIDATFMSPSGCPSPEVLLCFVFSSCMYLLHASLCTYLIAWYLCTYVHCTVYSIDSTSPPYLPAVGEPSAPTASKNAPKAATRQDVYAGELDYLVAESLCTCLVIISCLQLFLVYFLCCYHVRTYMVLLHLSPTYVCTYIHTYICVCVYVRSWMCLVFQFWSCTVCTYV